MNYEGGGYENIVELVSLQKVSFNMIRELEKVSLSDFSTDWIDGLVVAQDLLRNGSIGKKFATLRIFLITNFTVHVNEDQLDVAIDALRCDKIQLLGISDCVEINPTRNTDSQFTDDPFQTEQQSQSQKIFKEVLRKLESGDLCNINLAEARLLYFEKKKTRSVPWKSVLSIGSKFKICISAYVYTKDGSILSSFKTECSIPNTITRVFQEHRQNNEVIEKPDNEDLIKAYYYGDKIIPLEDDEDEPEEVKGLHFIAFFSKQRIFTDYLTGKGCHIVVAQRDMPKSVKNFYYMVEEMINEGQVMIAKKVYTNKAKPTFVVLIPEMNDKKQPSLKMIQIAFADDIIKLSFPPLCINRTKPTLEQEAAIKNLVENMNLMNVEIDSKNVEAFTVETSLNPVNQHLCRSVAYRALHPEEPLPAFKEDLAAMLDVPVSIKEKCKEIFEEIELNFPLERVEKKVKKTFGRKDESSHSDLVSNLGEDIDSDIVENDITEIGTITPAEDFHCLLKKGIRFSDIANQMEKIISDFLFNSAALQKQKIIECLIMYREQSKLFSPFGYNNWIREMKVKMLKDHIFEDATGSKSVDLWLEFIVKEGLGLITNEESPLSSITVADQFDFYETKNEVITDPNLSIHMVDDDELDSMLG